MKKTGAKSILVAILLGLLLSGDTHGQGKGRDKDKGEENVPPTRQAVKVSCAAFSSDNKWLVLGFDPNADKHTKEVPDAWKLHLYHVTSGKFTREFAGHKKGATFVAFLAGDKEILSVGQDGEARVWDIDSGKQTRSFFLSDPPPRCVAISPDTKSLWAYITQSGLLADWEVETGKQTIKHKRRNPITYLQIAPKGSLAIAHCQPIAIGPQEDDETIFQLLDLDSGKALETRKNQFDNVKGKKLLVKVEVPLEFSSDGQVLLSQVRYGKALLVDEVRDTGKKKEYGKSPGGYHLWASFSAKEDHIVAVSGSGLFACWRRKDGFEVWSKRGKPSEEPDVVTFSLDRSMVLIATGTDDTVEKLNINLYSLENGAWLAKFELPNFRSK